MAKTISVDNLGIAITNELKLYESNVVEKMKKANDQCMKEFVEDTKRDAPRGVRKKNKYYTQITSKTTLETPNSKTNVWYVKDPQYRLTHLIKNGHATRNGGRTRSNDFLTPNYEKLEKNFTQEIEKAITDGY